ncbi:MAG TPA: sulfatase-like hydrolase/transferase [Planctomycetota bacterium]|nr:sulfatase-like hydrolase/transferase [Planctomycetota bacterium]
MSETRRTFLEHAGLGLAAAACCEAAHGAEEAPRRPNLLVIITDQQHAGMLSCAGNTHVKTPHMDSLAATGTRFERAYCSNPVCVPSRFSLLSGVMPSRIGMEHNGHQRNPVPEAILRHGMGAVLRAAGYATAYGGKTHLPGAKGHTNNVADYGFDEVLTRDERDGLAQACAAFLRRKHDKPFLLVASFINPHDICYMAIDDHARSQGKPVKETVERRCLTEALALPEGVTREAFFRDTCPPLPPNVGIPEGEPEAVEKTDWRAFRAHARRRWSEEMWRLHRWAYGRLTERVDAEIGRVLQALREAGREDDTLVVFTSDHGDMDSAHRLEHKSMLYEEACRIPLLVSWKGVTKPGAVDREHLVSNGLDLIPTLCDYAGIAPPPELKGRSIRPLAEGREPKGWRDTLAVENERSRLVLWDRLKYGVYGTGERRELLVDLKQDPGEMRNRAAEPACRAQVEAGRRLLVEWCKEHGETLADAYVVKG